MKSFIEGVISHWPIAAPKCIIEQTSSSKVWRIKAPTGQFYLKELPEEGRVRRECSAAPVDL